MITPTFEDECEEEEEDKEEEEEEKEEALRGDLKFNPPPGVSFRSHGLFALRERTIVKRRTFASFFSLRSFSERGKKERARDQFKDANRRDIRREQSSDGVFVLSFEDAANRAGERDCD